MLEHNLHEPSFAASNTGETLPTARVDIWIVPLSSEPAERFCKDLWESLSADERTRAEHFVYERDRRRFLVGRNALRSILASYFGCLPREMRFQYGDHGKPMLGGAGQAAGIEFNAAGSEDLAVCAVAVGEPVGVDIELCRPLTDNAFIEQCLSPAEQRMHAALAPQDKPRDFYRRWTLKEAYLKATGAGLSHPLSTLELSLEPGEPVRLAADDRMAGGSKRWAFVEFSPAPGYLGALAISGGVRPVEFRQWPR